MRTKIWLGLAAATMLATMSPVGTAQAQSLGQNIFQKMFGTSDDQPQINYSERAPLVKPGRLDLPPPGKATDADSDPNWPKDPDEKKRKAAGGLTILPSANWIHGNTNLSPEEMKAGTLQGPSANLHSYDPGGQDDVKLGSNPLKPSELQKKMNFGTDDTPLVAGQEPPRRSLTDPPPGLRRPLASAPVDGSEPLPSEAGEDKPWYEKIFVTRGNH